MCVLSLISKNLGIKRADPQQVLENCKKTAVLERKAWVVRLWERHGDVCEELQHRLVVRLYEAHQRLLVGVLQGVQPELHRI